MKEYYALNGEMSNVQSELSVVAVGVMERVYSGRTEACDNVQEGGDAREVVVSIVIGGGVVWWRVVQLVMALYLWWFEVAYAFPSVLLFRQGRPFCLCNRLGYNNVNHADYDDACS